MKGSEPEGKESWRLYEKFKAAKTLREALILGIREEMKRIKDDYTKGFIRFPGRESIEPGHVFMADSEEANDLLSLKSTWNRLRPACLTSSGARRRWRI